jgi:hypothetical protein
VGKAKASKSPVGTIILIIVIFLAVLVAAILIQMLRSPDFSGFGKQEPGEPVVTREDGASASTTDEGAYDWKDHHVFIVGDSLTDGAAEDIAAVVEDSTIDAKVSRNMAAGVSILEDWNDAGMITDDAIIVVCLANNITNSTVSDAQKIIDMIEPGQSLIMMTGHGRTNMEAANKFIRNLPNEYSYITVADWDLTVAQSPSLLSDDGIHISKAQGNELYADLIVKALEVTKPMP